MTFLTILSMIASNKTAVSILRIKKIILLLGDVLLLYVALFCTVVIRYGHTLTYDLWVRHSIPFTFVFCIWIVVFFINNLYAVQFAKNDFKFYGYLVQNLIINALIGFTFFYLAPATLTSLRPLVSLILLLIMYAILFLLWRRTFYTLTASKALTNNLMIIGSNAEAIELSEAIVKNPQLGYALQLMVTFDQTPLPTSLAAIPRIRDLAGIVAIIRQYRIQTIVTVESPTHSPEVTRYLFQTLNLGIKYYNFPNFYEKLTGKIPVASLERSWFLENISESSRRLYEVAKRMQDILFALTFGIIALPLIPFIAAAITLSSPGPILFKQTRTGKGGKTFLAMKFRSMVNHAEQNGPQWAQKNDARVTRVGKFLRKTRLDEIPQFINILKGDMSFVGPRPERPEFVATLAEEIPFYRERLLIKPGLTGWAQINYKYGDTIDDAMVKLQYDLFYIKNRSFSLDISIILKTINTILNASLGQ